MTHEEIAKKVLENKTEIDKIHGQLSSLSTSVELLHMEHKQMYRNIEELLQIFQAGKGTLTMMGWIGKGVRWVVTIGIAVGAIIAYLKGWKLG